MKIEDIVFDENMEMYIFLPKLNKKVRLVLSDSLWAYEEKLSEEYKSKIVNFINNLPMWYNKAVESVIKYAKRIYGIETEEKDIRLMSIFILFEQSEDELYGLLFNTEFDIEHGGGLKILGSNFEITEIGEAEVAFC